MSVLSTLAMTVTVSDGSASLVKIIPAQSFTGTNSSYTQSFSVGTGTTTVTLPASPVQCLYIRNLAPAGVAAPAAPPILSQSAGGSLGATTYFVKITYVNAMGETTVSSESSLAVLANNVLVVASPPALGSATGYNVYVSNTGGGGSGSETLQTPTAIAIGVNWTEPTTGLVGGAAMPGANTTAAVVAVTWTKQGGSSGSPIDLWPGAEIAFCEPTSAGGFNAPAAKGGITAFTMTSSIAATSVEVVLGG